MQQKQIIETLTRVANEYPTEMAPSQLIDIPRIAFHIGLALEGRNSGPPSGLSLCDLRRYRRSRQRPSSNSTR